MRPSQHFALTLLSVLLVVMPALLLVWEPALILIPIAAGIGALLPDVDLQGKQNDKISGLGDYFGKDLGTKINKSIMTFYGIVSMFATVLYRIYVFALDKKLRHRGVFHSTYAALFLLVALGSIITIILMYGHVSQFWMLLSAYILIGMFVGFLFHLLQDSCTVMGVDWFNPFHSFCIAGKHQTAGNQTMPTLQIYTLMLANGVAGAACLGAVFEGKQLSGITTIMLACMFFIGFFWLASLAIYRVKRIKPQNG